MARSLIATTLLLLSPFMAAEEPTWQPFALRSYDGRSIDGTTAMLPFPERRDGSTKRTVSVAVVRLPSKAAQPGAPIVFLSGGPGIPATAIARVPVYFDLFASLQEISDVILIDQRGSGMSTPVLICPRSEIVTDFARTDGAMREALKTRVAECSAHWRGQGVDLAGYTTAEIAADVDEVRRAIRAPKVSLLAFSYGSEVAIEILRRWPRSVDRVIFASTRGPDKVLKEPRVWDDQLEAIGRMAGRPLRAEVAEIVQRLDASPIELASKDSNFTVGGVALLAALRNDLSDGRAIGKIPALVAALRSGDMTPLAPRVQQMHDSLRSSFNLMTLAVDCSSGWSSKRLAATQAQSATATMRNVNLQWDPEICSAIRPLRFKPLPPAKRTTVPALFITGSLDVNAPFAQAEVVRRSFRQSKHVMVKNAAHETLPARSVQTLAVDFMRGRWPSSTTIEVPPPQF